MRIFVEACGETAGQRIGVISTGQLRPLQLTSRDMVMELRSDWTVDDPGLEAGVIVTKIHRGCHCGGVV